MKVYRYNAKERSHRHFNTTGKEKNPNRVKFYARSIDYAEKYKFIYTDDGDVWYECELEEVELDDNAKLFDLSSHFAETNAYKCYINDLLGKMTKDFSRYLLNAKKKRSKAMYARFLADIANGTAESEEVERLKRIEFQRLSDYQYQNVLVAELRDKGFQGYITANEIALF